MAVRIRLQRHGKKGKPFYWIVAADSRSKRDGKFLEKLGTYNPNTNPAQIQLNIEDAVKWLQNGAQPSETARRILSYKGAMLKYHLLRGVAKGALTEAGAEEKFQTWIAEKEKKVETKKDNLAKAKSDEKIKALEAEKEVSEKRKAAITVTEEDADTTPNAAAAPVEDTQKAEETATAETTSQAPEEAPKETAQEEKPVAETSGKAEENTVAETASQEPEEAPKETVQEEKPVAETSGKAEETAAAETTSQEPEEAPKETAQEEKATAEASGEAKETAATDTPKKPVEESKATEEAPKADKAPEA